MTMLSLRIEDESVRAEKVLKTASAMLNLLRAIEKDLHKKGPWVEWVVDILTGSRIAIVKFTPVATSNQKIATKTAKEAMAMMENARWGVTRPAK